MSTRETNYIATIGLEIHMQLKTQRKMFSPEAVTYGEPPNSYTSPITLAHPGTLPQPNKKAINYALMMGLACESQVVRENYFARKNYYYPDLPKGFQITQDATPICRGGYIVIPTKNGEKKIALERIHIEEDTGKSIHAPSAGVTLINYDRAGTPVIEVVTKPVLQTPEEAYTLLMALRRLVRYLDISDGNMEEGSLRCDVNVSVRPEESSELNTKVEIKNLNSMRHVRLAASHEIKRQSAIYQRGGVVMSETRAYDPIKNMTTWQRTKEGLTDYCYFPEPDISPIVISEEKLIAINEAMPILPHQLYHKLIDDYKLPPADAVVLTEDKSIGLFFEAIAQQCVHHKIIANLIIGPVKAYLNQEKLTMRELGVTSDQIVALANMIADEVISFSLATLQLFPLLIGNPDGDPATIAQAQGWVQTKNQGRLLDWIEEVMAAYPDKVAAYQSGKKGLLGFFMGEIMRISHQKANPQETAKLLKKKLES
ncbi:MAG: Asp-tRNA(Asn)/Glu-tRNA(Gln) amidotransferase subunit GatB [Bacteroidota bacterium]